MSLRRVFFSGKNRKGFSLIELTVSMGVMAMIFGITMSGGPQSLVRISLAENTYQAELLIREVQLQGSSINSLNNTYGGAGVFFDRATSTQTLKFKDRAVFDPNRAISIGDGLYVSGPIDEKESVLVTTNRHVIGKLCVATTSPSVFYCNNDNPPTIPNIKTLTISFSRPKQTAHIYVNNSTSSDYSSACIQFDSFRSPEHGFVKSILVYKSGMITKRTAPCK
jgi:prepilin-type N-terminal cleavage/methylation domain-containing protein